MGSDVAFMHGAFMHGTPRIKCRCNWDIARAVCPANGHVAASAGIRIIKKHILISNSICTQ